MKGSRNINLVVETPRKSQNKFKYEEKRDAFKLSRALPAGFSFPFDFGFVPSTLAEDGDPIDVLLLMDEPTFVGCTIEARLIGVIERSIRQKTVRRNATIGSLQSPRRATRIASGVR